MLKSHRVLGWFAILAILGVSGICANAETADFYRGKQIRLIIGNSVGAEYDLGGRLLARHLGRHIPGQPAIVVQNMQGAAGIFAANYLYNAAPRDGTVIGSVSRNIPIQAALGRDNLKADPRNFGWLCGSGGSRRAL